MASQYLYYDWNDIMRNKSLKLCVFTCVIGIFGAFSRWLQIQNIFEAETGLSTPNSPLSYFFVIYSLLGMVSLIIYVSSFKKATFPMHYPAVYYRGSRFYSISAIAIGVLMALGGVMTIIHSMGKTGSVFDLVLGLFSFAGAISMASFIVSANKNNGKKGGSIQSVTIVLFLCFWLIAAYKFSASDPVIWHFAPRLLAIASTILAFYYIAGFVFNKPNPILCLHFCQLGTFLCIITLADSFPIGEQIFVLSFALYMMLLTYAQVKNCAFNQIPSKNKNTKQ